MSDAKGDQKRAPASVDTTVKKKAKLSQTSLSTESSPSANAGEKKSKKKASLPSDGAAPEKLKKDKLAIDDLFSKAVAKKKQDQEHAREQKEKEEEAEKREKKVADEAKRAMTAGSSTEPRIHRWDKESGLPVYKYYDLRMGEPGSGFTPLCPFDCDCCF